ncbi:tRNA (adenosine(37)-N6)-threonylcarbamoyltransferase complex ATPase subunit type 1 TsaE [soil metagenome]
MEVIFRLEDIAVAARKFLEITAATKVFALHGEMGAGKTTFTHAFCEAMGVTDNISSPTFSIVNEYTSASGQAVYHIDLYRLKNEAEATEAGVEDCLYSGSTCLVEWPERAPGIFPDNTLHIRITAIDNNTRKLSFDVK